MKSLKRLIPHIVLIIFISCQASKKEDRILLKNYNFSVDVYEVTTENFAQFVSSENYVTTADSLQWSAVFNLNSNKWEPLPLANWKMPNGFDEAIPTVPVTQISYYDACAYCEWKDGRLPTAEEWDHLAGSEIRAGNVWQGVFPVKDLAEDGYDRIAAPVGSFEPNTEGLYDLFGNVWEWTSTEEDGQMIIKGGSYLCDKSFCSGYYPERYQKTPKDSGLNHLGFRCVYDD